MWLQTDSGCLASGAKHNGLSEADFHVFGKLGENGLQRGLEAETFSRGQVCGEHNFLNALRPKVDRYRAGVESTKGHFDRGTRNPDLFSPVKEPTPLDLALARLGVAVGARGFSGGL
jgi:hypothetical protein